MTPTTESVAGVLEDIKRCEECGSSNLLHRPPEYERSGTMTERIDCDACGAAYVQRWALEARVQERPGS